MMHWKTLLASVLFAFSASVQAADVNWISDASGEWSTTVTTSIWSTGSLPQPGDHVIVDRSSADPVITHSFGTTSINSLFSTEAMVIDGGSFALGAASTIQNTLLLSNVFFPPPTLKGTGTLDVLGKLTWTHGKISDAGVLNARGGISIEGNSSSKALENGRTLKLYGNSTWSGAADLTVSGGASISIELGATFDIVNAQRIFAGNLYAFPLNNAGTLTKSSGTGASQVQLRLNNSGSVEAKSGTLHFNNGGDSSGSFSVQAGATLRLGGSQFSPTNLLQGSSITSTGGLIVLDNDVNISGVVNAASVRAADGHASGWVKFKSGATVNIGQLSLAGTDVNFATGNVITLGSLVFEDAPSGANWISGPDTVNISGQLRIIDGGFRGPGTINATGGIEFLGMLSTVHTGRMFVNNAVLNNVGLASWTGNAGISISNGRLNNLESGVFEVHSNSELGGFGSNGTFDNRGVMRKLGNVIGQTQISSRFENSGMVEIHSGSIRMTGGGLSSGGYALASDTMLTLDNGDFTFGSTSNLSAPQATVRIGGAQVTISGTFEAGVLEIAAGKLVLATTNTIRPSSLVKSGGDLSITASTELALSSADYVQSGGRTFVTGVLSAPKIEIEAGSLSGTGVLQGNVVQYAETAPGSSIGTLRVAGDFEQNSTGNLSIEILGRLAGQQDALLIDGTASLDGSLTVTLLNGFVPVLGDQFVVMTFAGRSGNFKSLVGMELANGFKLDPVFSATDFSLHVVAVPEPGQYLLMLAALILLARVARSANRKANGGANTND